MSNPLLSAKEFSVEDEEGTLAAALTFETEGTNVALVGDATALVRVLSRTARRKSGTLELVGQPAGAFIGTSRLGMMLAEQTLPESLSGSQYLSLGAGLTGLGAWPAAQAASVALGRLGLERLGKRLIRSLLPEERRALCVAQAVVGNPRVVLLERLFDGLADDEQGPLLDVVRRAGEGRRLILTSVAPPATGIEAEFLLALDHAVVFSEGRVVGSGPPAEVLVRSATCVVWASRSCSALVAALTAKGVRVEASHPERSHREAGRLLVHLSGGSTPQTVVEAAIAVGAPLLGLVPVGLEAKTTQPSP